MIEGAAFPRFQLPIYGLTLWIVGADKTEMGTLLVLTPVLMLMISRLFGMFLQTMRKLAKVNAG